jgi:hypothetical protein
VFVGVRDGVCEMVAVPDTVAVGLVVGDWVIVGDAVTVAVLAGVAVEVIVADKVGVALGGKVPVTVTVLVRVTVGVGDAVGDAVSVGGSVAVSVGVGAGRGSRDSSPVRSAALATPSPLTSARLQRSGAPKMIPTTASRSAVVTWPSQLASPRGRTCADAPVVRARKKMTAQKHRKETPASVTARHRPWNAKPTTRSPPPIGFK